MSNKPIRIAVLVSNPLWSVESLKQAERENSALFEIKMIISEKREITEKIKENIAKDENIIVSLVGENVSKEDREKYHLCVSTETLKIIKKETDGNIDFIILDGFYVILTDPLLSSFKNQILNVHPSLLPKFGGKGMFGKHVHNAVIAAHESESGCTIHIVDEGGEIDKGEIIWQEKVRIDEGETAESLEKKVKNIETNAIVNALKILQKRKRL